MAPKRSGLGKGLGNLIPDSGTKKSEATKEKEVIVKKEVVVEKEVVVSNEPITLKITEVEPNKSQPRKYFKEDALQELSESIKQYGIVQPLVVQKRDDYYEIIAGERRWRAAKLAGLKEVPVIIKDYSDQEIVEIALIENIQREDLNPIEEALAYKRLLQEFNLKHDEVAEKVSKSRVTITNSMRLLNLCDEVQQMVIDEMLSSGHARTLVTIEDAELQHRLALEIFDKKLSVREAEKLVKEYTNPKKKIKKETNPQDDIIFEDIENKIKTAIGTNVKINRKKNNKGKIEIEYYSSDELERLVDLLMEMGQK